MKKYNLIEVMQNIKDETLEKILSITTKEDLKRQKMKEKEKNKGINLKWIGAFAACLCVVLIGVVQMNIYDKDTRVKINNPLTEVNSTSKMKEYLGFEIPVLKTKEVKSYIVIGNDNDNDKYAYHGRIIYKDKSEFEMEKGNKDVSGINGGVKEQTKIISNTQVTILTLDDIRYAIWFNKNYSYSYSSSLGDNKFINDLENIVSLTNK